MSQGQALKKMNSMLIISLAEIFETKDFSEELYVKNSNRFKAL